MKWTCSAVRRRLAEYHDGELTIDQRVAIQSHLRACAACAAEGEQLHLVTTALRAAAVERSYAVDSHDLDGLAAGVVSRLRAERDESFPFAVRRMFEDLHLVWAALSATAATCVCLAVTVGIFYFSKAERPDSLAGQLYVLSNPGTDANPMQADRIGPYVALPRQELEPIAAMPVLTTDQDVLVESTITKEGRVTDLQLMNWGGPTGERAANDWKVVGQVLDSVARARFAPTRSQVWRGSYFSGVAGEPIAVKVFWYFTHTTVIGESDGEPEPESDARPKAPGEARHGARPAVHVVATSVV
jgi:hypothetical protein